MQVYVNIDRRMDYGKKENRGGNKISTMERNVGQCMSSKEMFKSSKYLLIYCYPVAWEGMAGSLGG